MENKQRPFTYLNSQIILLCFNQFVLLVEISPGFGHLFHVMRVYLLLHFANLPNKFPSADIIPQVSHWSTTFIYLLLYVGYDLPYTIKFAAELLEFQIELIDSFGCVFELASPSFLDITNRESSYQRGGDDRKTLPYRSTPLWTWLSLFKLVLSSWICAETCETLALNSCCESWNDVFKASIGASPSSIWLSRS